MRLKWLLKNLSPKNSSDLDRLSAEYHETFKENLIKTLLKTFYKLQPGGTSLYWPDVKL